MTPSRRGKAWRQRRTHYRDVQSLRRCNTTVLSRGRRSSTSLVTMGAPSRRAVRTTAASTTSDVYLWPQRTPTASARRLRPGDIERRNGGARTMEDLIRRMTPVAAPPEQQAQVVALSRRSRGCRIRRRSALPSASWSAPRGRASRSRERVLYPGTHHEGHGARPPPYRGCPLVQGDARRGYWTRCFSVRGNGPTSARENGSISRFEHPQRREPVGCSECSEPTRSAPLAARIGFDARIRRVGMSCRRDVLRARAGFRWTGLSGSNARDRQPLRKWAEQDARWPSRRRDGACDGFALVRPGAEAFWGQRVAVEIAVIASMHGDTERRGGALGE